jgi:hypothetical protein
MSIVMVLQSLLSYFIGNLIGSMEAMIPGGFIGMGAMIVAYLPLPNRYLMIALGAMSGLVISMVFVILDVRLRRASFQEVPFRRSSGKVSSPSFTLRKPSWLYDLQEMAGARRRALPKRRSLPTWASRFCLLPPDQD